MLIELPFKSEARKLENNLSFVVFLMNFFLKDFDNTIYLF